MTAPYLPPADPYHPAMGRSPYDHGSELEITVDGGAVNAFVGGPLDGPVVLMVHGLGGTWQNWWTTIPVLSDAGYRVVAVDLPGFGRSPLPGGELTMRGLAATCLGVLDALGVGRAAVVGNSMGGFVAGAIAIAAPRRVAALVLNSAAGMTPRNEKISQGRLVGAIGAAVAVSSVPGRRFPRAFASRPALRKAAFSLLVGDPDRVDREALFHLLAASGRSPGYVRALRAVMVDDLRDDAATIIAPTLVVSGDRDRIVPPKASRRWARTVPGARLVTLEGVGHLPMVERPRDFGVLLLDFLAEAGWVRAADPPELTVLGRRPAPAAAA